MSVTDEHRATAAGICDDRRVRFAKRVEVLSRQLTRAFEISSVRVQRAATDLRLRRVHLESVSLQHTPRRSVNSREESLSDTTLKQQHGFTFIPAWSRGYFLKDRT